MAARESFRRNDIFQPPATLRAHHLPLHPGPPAAIEPAARSSRPFHRSAGPPRGPEAPWRSGKPLELHAPTCCVVLCLDPFDAEGARAFSMVWPFFLGKPLAQIRPSGLTAGPGLVAAARLRCWWSTKSTSIPSRSSGEQRRAAMPSIFQKLDRAGVPNRCDRAGGRPDRQPPSEMAVAARSARAPARQFRSSARGNRAHSAKSRRSAQEWQIPRRGCRRRGLPAFREKLGTEITSIKPVEPESLSHRSRVSTKSIQRKHDERKNETLSIVLNPAAATPIRRYPPWLVRKFGPPFTAPAC